jgi:plastocyanin
MRVLQLHLRRAFAEGRAWLGVLLILAASGYAKEVTLAARVEMQHRGKGKTASDPSNVVVWLTRIGGSASSETGNSPAPHPRLLQRNKSFEPHVVVVHVGSSVEFPNRDPFFHNVFSLFEGKRFDLGLYEAGTTRDVHFDRPGISYIFCNIHPEMSAVVIAVETPYYAISDRRGEVQISGVPPGRYLLRVWSEASLPDDLKSQAREVTISESTSSLGIIRLKEIPVSHAHKNKYGQDYEPPDPASPVYERP